MINISIYKGYLKGNGKSSAIEFKGDDSVLVKYNTARRYDSFVGILSEDMLMLDIDSPEESDVLLDIIEDMKINCSVLETTNGIHVYFKAPEDLRTNKIDWWSPLGLQVTIKLGSRNTADPLKIDGETRSWYLKSKRHDELPKWLYPMVKINKNRDNNYIDQISDGSRNQDLFNYILKLQSAELSKQEIKETINLVNKYILDHPLDQREINTILRDEAFKKESFFKGNRFLHDKFAQFLISEYNIIRIKDVLHIYKEGIYSDNIHDIERAMIHEIRNLKKTQRSEVLAYLQLATDNKPLSPPHFIAVKNGIYDLNKDRLLPFSPEIVIKNKVNWNYNPTAECPPVDKVLNNVAVKDKQVRRVLEEIFGYILYRRNVLRKTFLLTGHGQNGKSTYLKMLLKFVGEENKSALDLNELSERFKTAELFGKLANIGDDISKLYIKDSSMFKKLSTGDTVNAERKGLDPFDFNNYAKLIFSANEPPRVNDKSDGIVSRLLIIPFKAKFTPQDPDFDPQIEDKVTNQDAMEYLLKLGIIRLKEILERKHFTQSDVIQKESDAYNEYNNPLLRFIKETEIVNRPTKEVFIEYAAWCEELQLKPLGSTAFSREICQTLDLETKQIRDGKRRKSVFVSSDY
ncbi:DNA primase family protein [Facklamia sp. P12937]|uniref:DNA primase family protein n=1 Tax=Facklamia sp. P12937 TaxID=3421949 RepID=UPI003D17384D